MDVASGKQPPRTDVGPRSKNREDYNIFEKCQRLYAITREVMKDHKTTRLQVLVRSNETLKTQDL